MKRVDCLAVIIAAVLSVNCFAARQSVEAQPTPAAILGGVDIENLLRDRIDRLKRSFALVVGIVGPDGRTRVVTHGMASKDDARRPDAKSVFEIGSVTKVFTALLLSDMVVRGEVRLDDPVSKYLPRTVKAPTRGGKEITLLDLATHTSGLPRLPGNMNPREMANPYADYDAAAMYQFLSGAALARDIGAKYEYSNLGAGLLGHLLSLRGGSSFEAMVRNRICEPLKMHDTRIQLTAEMKSRLVPGHSASLDPARNWDLSVLEGAGGLRSTVDDLLRFLTGIMDPKSPLALAVKQQLNVTRSTANRSMRVGMGWHVRIRGDDTIIWHNGETGGYHAFVGFDPKRRMGVVVLANAANSIDDIALHLLDRRYELAKIEPRRVRKEIKVDAKTLEAYTGRYELTPSFVMTITTMGSRLYLQATGQPKVEAFPETNADFFLKVVDAQITFVRDGGGQVTSLVLHQNGSSRPAKRIR